MANQCLNGRRRDFEVALETDHPRTNLEGPVGKGLAAGQVQAPRRQTGAHGLCHAGLLLPQPGKPHLIVHAHRPAQSDQQVDPLKRGWRGSGLEPAGPADAGAAGLQPGTDAAEALERHVLQDVDVHGGDVLPASAHSAGSGQQRIEAALTLEDVEVVAAAHVLIINEDLRHRTATVGAALHHRAPSRGITVDRVLLVAHTFAIKELLGADAEGAGTPGVDLDPGHGKGEQSAPTLPFHRLRVRAQDRPGIRPSGRSEEPRFSGSR